MTTDWTGFCTCKECHKTESPWNHTTTDHNEGEQLEDRRNFGESICNSGDRTDQRGQSLMFMMMVYLPLLNGPQHLFTHNNASSCDRRDKMRTLFRFSELTDDVQTYIFQTLLWPLSVPHVTPDMASCGIGVIDIPTEAHVSLTKVSFGLWHPFVRYRNFEAVYCTHLLGISQSTRRHVP
jgi:hypothetical protein